MAPTLVILLRFATASALCLGTGCALAPTAPATTEQPAAQPPMLRLDLLPASEPDQQIAYGSEASQFGDLRLPPGPGPHPVVVLIHGGCFKAAYASNRDLAAIADALRKSGIATWNIEYRRLGEAAPAGPAPIWMSRAPSISCASSRVRIASTCAAWWWSDTRPAGTSPCGPRRAANSAQAAPCMRWIRCRCAAW